MSPLNWLLGFVGVKLTTVVPSGIPTPDIKSPGDIPPWIFLTGIIALGPTTDMSVKHTADWLYTLSIGTVSTTFTATASDSLYSISISFIFKAFSNV